MPDWVASEEVALSAAHPAPSPQELALLGVVREKRRNEFFAGRHCARKALEALGIEGFSVLNAPDRSPIWPQGVVGSITHTGDPKKGFCAAAVARSTDVVALGIDAEMREGIEPRLWNTLFTARELASLTRWPEAERAEVALVMFSAKECAYKCQYPFSKTFLSFHDLEIHLDLNWGFVAVLQRDISGHFAQNSEWTGRYLTAADVVLTTMLWRSLP